MSTATENTPSSTSSLVSRSTRASCASRSTTPSVCPGVSASHCNVRGHKDPAKPCCFQKGCCNPDCPGNDESVGTFGHGATATSIEAFIVWIRRANNVDLVFPPPTGVTRESLGCGCLCPQCFGEFRKFKRGFVSTDLARALGIYCNSHRECMYDNRGHRSVGSSKFSVLLCMLRCRARLHWSPRLSTL